MISPTTFANSRSHSRLDAALRRAVRQNDAAALEQALASGANPRQAISTHSSLLLDAVLRGHEAVALRLLEAGATALDTGESGTGRLPLHEAMNKGMTEVVRRLVCPDDPARWAHHQYRQDWCHWVERSMGSPSPDLLDEWLSAHPAPLALPLHRRIELWSRLYVQPQHSHRLPELAALCPFPRREEMPDPDAWAKLLAWMLDHSNSWVRHQAQTQMRPEDAWLRPPNPYPTPKTQEPWHTALLPSLVARSGPTRADLPALLARMPPSWSTSASQAWAMCSAAAYGGSRPALMHLARHLGLDWPTLAVWAPEGSTLLHHVVANTSDPHHRARLMRALLAAGANPHAIDTRGQTPLHVLWDSRHSRRANLEKMAAPLLDAGVSMLIFDNRSHTPLDLLRQHEPDMAAQQERRLLEATCPAPLAPVRTAPRL